jgi:hypothetical protein
LRAASSAAALCVVALAAIALANARTFPPGGGYDADAHLRYADDLLHGHGLPRREPNTEYYTPPGFYLVAAGATRVGEALGLGEPHRLALVVNAAALVGTALLLLALARLLFPGRRWLHAGAVGYFSFLPVVIKTGAMFHPEPLSLLVSTAAVLLAARMLVRRSLGLRQGAALGVVLGAAQLVRAFTLWTFAAVVVAFLVAAGVRAAPRRDVLRALAVVVAVTAAVTAPWYVRQAIEFGNPVFAPRSSRADEPWFERRPASFYTALGLPAVFTEPFRPHFRNDALPTTYSELWGDYFGAYGWRAPPPPAASQLRQLRIQAAVGALPTLLAVGGWLALLVAALRRRAPALLLAALVPALGLLGYLYFTVGYPTRDGDVLKATYMLTTAPFWALGFGYALDAAARRGRTARVALVVVLVASALASLPFLLYG